MAPIQKLLSIASLALAPLLNRQYTPIHAQPDIGAVSSESAICSKIGTSILKVGGTAADAMVATTLCVGVTGMYHSGIGGGGFMIVRPSKGEPVVIDFRETAPIGATETMFVNQTIDQLHNGKAVGVPGELRGLQTLHDRFGGLPWKDLVMPSVELARNGWIVGEDLVKYMGRATEGEKDMSAGGFLVSDPDFAIDFAPEGELLGLGDTITRKRYADTLEWISDYGADGFYTGVIADATIRAIQSRGGIMTHADLENYQAVIREPVKSTYRGHRIASVGAPASGASLSLMLNVLDGYPHLGEPENFNMTTHQIIETMRFGFAARSELGDPSIFLNQSLVEDRMTSKVTSDYVQSQIRQNSQPVKYYNPFGFETLESHGTSQISVADSSGFAISLTTTVNLLFGNHQVVPETGVILNNEMDDFSTPGVSNSFGFVPSPVNFIRPFARPVSSIVACIVDSPDGQLRIVTGAGGGSRIITSTLLSIINMIDFNMSVSQALEAPRYHDQLQPNTVRLEYKFNNATATFLAERRHNVTWMAPGLSAVQAIQLLPNGTFEAAGEPRQKQSGGYTI